MKILVVDDEHSAGTLLGIALRRLGHEPLLALHPHDALGMLTSDIDAVITDLEMPVMNGVQLARAIREEHADMPIAFCTGSDPGDGVAAEAAKMGRVYPKRWSPARVRALLGDLGFDD